MNCCPIQAVFSFADGTGYQITIYYEGDSAKITEERFLNDVANLRKDTQDKVLTAFEARMEPRYRYLMGPEVVVHPAFLGENGRKAYDAEAVERIFGTKQ